MSQNAAAPDNVRGEIAEIIARQAGIATSAVSPQATLKDLGVASIDAIGVLFDLEEHFDITFPDQGPEFDKDTVQNLVDAVHAALAAKRAEAGE